MKRIIEYLVFCFALVLLVFSSGCVEQPIGGERDEHGCLGPAGYTWDENVGACLRDWELNDNQKQAAKIAVDDVGQEYSLTILEVMVARCPGCFAVKLEKGKDRIDVTIENWEVKEISLTIEEGKYCVVDEDCAVFGETGDCNCGCYNKDNLPSSTGGECFCSAPIDCKCVNGKCEGIFEGDMSYSEARLIAEQSECVEEGDLTEHARFSGTNNWEIDFEPFTEKEGCNPVCVVSPIERTASINWRCTGVISCAKDGEIFSTVYDKYPDQCCEGLKEWLPIPDTRFSIADVCYEVGPPSESNLGMCIECGNGICENHLMYDENPCNCPEDCAGKNKSHFSSIEDFCLSNDWNLSLSKACEETFKGFPICELC